MKKIFIALTVLMIPLQLLLAQKNGKITGITLNKATKQKIPYINLKILGTKLGAISDIDGKFVIENIPMGTYSMQVNSVGYKTIVVSDIMVTPSKPVELSIELSEMAVELEGVTIKADYFQKSNFDAVSVKKFTYEEIRRAPGGFEDVIRALSVLPGVAQTSAGRNDLIVRGGAPSENLYVIDGFPVQNINHFGNQGATGGSLSYVNLDYLKESSFSTGGFGVNYGDKLSSVLSIDLKDARKDKIGGKATISATQFGLNLEGPVSDNSGFLFSARRSYLDFIFKAAGFGFVPEYWDYLGKYNYKIDTDNQISFLLIGAIDNVKFFNDSQDKRYDNSRILGSDQKQYLTGVKYRKFFSKGFLDVNLSRNYINYNSRQSDSNLVEIFRNNSTEAENTINSEVTLSIDKSSDFIVGASYKLVQFKADAFFPDFVTSFGELLKPGNIYANEDFNKADFYTQYSSMFFNHFRFNFGVRLDYFNAIENKVTLSPRTSLNYMVNESSTFTLSAGRYTQAPSYIWLIANKNNKKLEYVKADQYSLGFEHRPMLDLSLKLEAFYKKYSDYPASLLRPYLVLANTGAGYTGSEDNFASFGFEELASLGKGESKGLELSLQKKLSNIPIFGIMSLTYSKTSFTAVDKIERKGSYDQTWIFSLSGGYIPNEKWEFGAKFRIATGNPYTPYNSDGSQNVANYNAARFDPSHSLDIRVDRKWLFETMNLITYIDVQNVYNNKKSNSIRWDRRDKKTVNGESVGILPSIGISIEF